MGTEHCDTQKWIVNFISAEAIEKAGYTGTNFADVYNVGFGNLLAGGRPVCKNQQPTVSLILADQ